MSHWRDPPFLEDQVNRFHPAFLVCVVEVDRRFQGIGETWRAQVYVVVKAHQDSGAAGPFERCHLKLFAKGRRFSF